VEDAVVAALRPLMVEALGGEAGGYLRSCAPYNGELEGDLEQARARLAGRLPGVLVAIEEGRFNQEFLTRRRAREDLVVAIVAFSGNVRSREAQTRGGPDWDPGLYQLLEDMHGRLVGYKPTALAAGVMQALDERVLAQLPDLCAWRVRYEVPVYVFRDPEAADDDLTLLEGTQYDPEDEQWVAAGTGSLSVASGTCTVSGGTGLTSALVGHLVEVHAAANEANLGIRKVSAVPSSSTLQFFNAAGVAEASGLSWRVRPTLETFETEV
jgi:hypothetical protein